MDFGKLLSRSWEIMWANKFMLILGFLAALGGVSFNFNVNFPSTPSGASPPVQDISNAWASIERYSGLLVAGACAVFLLMIILWLVRLIAQAALIDTASRADHGEKVTLGYAFQMGWAKLSAMLGLNLLAFSPFLLTGLLFMVLTAATLGTAVISTISSGSPDQLEAVASSIGLMFACFGLLFCLLTPLWVVASLLYPFAQRSVVLGNMRPLPSLRHSWQMLRDNIGDILLLTILFIALGFIFNIAIALILFPLAIFSAGPIIFQLVQGYDISTASIVIAILGAILILILNTALNAILIAYRSTAITLAYEIFAGKTAVSPLPPSDLP